MYGPTTIHLYRLGVHLSLQTRYIPYLRQTPARVRDNDNVPSVSIVPMLCQHNTIERTGVRQEVGAE